jgi:transcriptional regulator with XRE-family HTH domain
MPKRPVRPNEPAVTQVFAGRLLKARIARGLTQAELARRVGCDPSLISRLEDGTRAPSLVDGLNMAAVLGMSLDALHTELRSQDMVSFATVRVESTGLTPEELADRLTDAARRCADVMVYVEDFGRMVATDS